MAAALVAGFVAAIIVLRANLISSSRDATTARAESVAALVTEGVVPDPLVAGEGVLVIEVVDPAGGLFATSLPNGDLVPYDRFATEGDETEGEPIRVSEQEVDFEIVVGFDVDGPVELTWLSVDVDGQPHEVRVYAALESQSSVDAFVRVLVPGLPLVLAMVAAIVWWVTGRALRPVEAMRAEAAAIGGADLGRRLPVPRGSDEITRLAETMNRMLDRIESSAERQRRFVADASHELKSPVAAIRTMLEVADASPGSVSLEELTRDLLAEDLRLERLVADLLVLARTDEDGLTLETVEVDLDDLVAEEAGAATSRFGIAIDATGVEAARVIGDAERLRRLLRNLLDNAVRHAAGQVWVALERDRGSALLTVSDDGPGIPPGQEERVFERFVRLDTARSRDKGGTGLGLAVVRAIAVAHGGWVEVDESRHGGATLAARLPLARS